MSSVRKAKKHLDVWSRYHYRYRYLCREDGPILVHRGDRKAWDRYARAASNRDRLWILKMQKESGKVPVLGTD